MSCVGRLIISLWIIWTEHNTFKGNCQHQKFLCYENFPNLQKKKKIETRLHKNYKVRIINIPTISNVSIWPKYYSVVPNLNGVCVFKDASMANCCSSLKLLGFQQWILTLRSWHRVFDRIKILSLSWPLHNLDGLQKKSNWVFI